MPDIYRQHGCAAYSAPQFCTEGVNEVIAQIFTELIQDKQTIIDAVVPEILREPQ